MISANIVNSYDWKEFFSHETYETNFGTYINSIFIICRNHYSELLDSTDEKLKFSLSCEVKEMFSEIRETSFTIKENFASNNIEEDVYRKLFGLLDKLIAIFEETISKDDLRTINKNLSSLLRYYCSVLNYHISISYNKLWINEEKSKKNKSEVEF